MVGKNVIRDLVMGDMTTSLQVMLEDDREKCWIAARCWKVGQGSLDAPEARVVLTLRNVGAFGFKLFGAA
jgi:hypothetical protein